MSSEMVEILQASMSDLPAIERLFEAIELEEGSSAPGAATEGLQRSMRVFSPFARQNNSVWLFCARSEGVLVGYATAIRIPKLDARLGYLFIDELHVLRSHRRFGAATALVRAVATLGAELGYRGVRLNVGIENVAARRLYAELGFNEHQLILCEQESGSPRDSDR